MILVYATFFAGVLYYLSSREEPSMGFVAFLAGAFLGVISSLILTWISLESFSGSASFFKETTRIYFTYFFIPIIISVPVYLLFAFSLSEETFVNLPAMLLGLFTVIFIVATFVHRYEPESFKAEILLLLIFSVVFLAELLVKIFLSLTLIPPSLGFLIAIACLMILCFPISLILGMYHFTNARFFTLTISVVLLVALIIPQRIISITK